MWLSWNWLREKQQMATDNLPQKNHYQLRCSEPTTCAPVFSHIKQKLLHFSTWAGYREIKKYCVAWPGLKWTATLISPKWLWLKKKVRPEKKTKKPNKQTFHLIWVPRSQFASSPLMLSYGLGYTCFSATRTKLSKPSGNTGYISRVWMSTRCTPCQWVPTLF